MVFTDLCPPALIYLLFSITQVVIDTVKGLYNTALIKIWVAVIFTILLNYLCISGLGIISWLIVFIPFILMTLVVSILLIMFGLDPSTGKIKVGKKRGKKKCTKNKKKSCKKDKKDEDLGEDKIMDYYNRYDTGKGSGGGSMIENQENTDNNDNSTNKILQKSFIYYTTKEEDLQKKIQNKKTKGDNNNNTDNAASYNDENSVNDIKYKLFVDDITTMLYGMGEQDIASWFKNRANECLNNLSGVKKDFKQLKIEECFQDILDEMLSKFNNNKKNLFKKNYKERVCQIDETMDTCKNRIIKGWWN